MVPGELNMQETVVLPEPATLTGETVHEVLLVARVTIAAKPSSPVTVTLEVAGPPLFTLTLAGLAVIVKS